jgi:hypothetical protein
VLATVVVLSVVIAAPSWAADKPPAAPAAAAKPAANELAAKPEDYCGICESRKTVNQLLPWMTWGADERLRWEYRVNATTLNGDADNTEYSYQRFRTRLWTSIRPFEPFGVAKDQLDLGINARVVWEFFNYCQPEYRNGIPDSDATFDNLNVTWKKVLGLPATIVAGRQDIRLGDGWLVLEGTPLDGSRTTYFDAIRLTVDPDEKNKLDLIYIENKADTDMYIEPFNDIGRVIAENDERGIIAYWSNKSLEKTQIDGYFIYYHAEEVDSSNTNADIYTVGSRVAGALDDNWKYRAEGALQFGNNEGTSICGAYGVNSRLTYEFNDDRKSAAYLGYEIRSGDDDARKNFNILWGRYPQWSDLYSGYLDTMEGPPAASENYHRVNLGYTFKPSAKTTLLANYNLLFAYENNMSAAGFSSDGCLRGQLVSGLLKYDFNEHLSGHLLGEVFFPGDYYTKDKNDVAFFGRCEMVLTW